MVFLTVHTPKSYSRLTDGKTSAYGLNKKIKIMEIVICIVMFTMGFVCGAYASSQIEKINR